MPLDPKTGELITINPTTGLPVRNYKSPMIISNLQRRGERTPDINELKFYKKIPFFAYGLDKTHGSDASLLENAEYLGRAHTLSANFVMRENSYFPIVAPVENLHASRGHIRGEMYNVTVEHLIALDNANTNTRIFHRVKNRFLLEDQFPEELKTFKDLKFIHGYMYIGDTKWWEKSNIKIRPRTAYPGHDKLADKQFYEWVNKIEDDDEYDEWGYQGQSRMGFWHH